MKKTKKAILNSFLGAIVFCFTCLLVLYFVKARLPDSNWLIAQSWDVLTADKRNKLIPSWTVIFYLKNTCPDGYLLANGSTISSSTYPALYSVLGSTFGGNGKLPDLRWEFIRGFDNGRNIDSGRVFGSSQIATSIINKSRATAVRSAQASNSDWVWASINSYYILGWTAASLPTALVRPRNVALLPCIKY